jgi:hypothetical protein
MTAFGAKGSSSTIHRTVGSPPTAELPPLPASLPLAASSHGSNAARNSASSTSGARGAATHSPASIGASAQPSPIIGHGRRRCAASHSERWGGSNLYQPRAAGTAPCSRAENFSPFDFWVETMIRHDARLGLHPDDPLGARGSGGHDQRRKCRRRVRLRRRDRLLSHAADDRGPADRGACAEAIGAPLQCWGSAMTWEGHELLDKIRRAARQDPLAWHLE